MLPQILSPSMSAKEIDLNYSKILFACGIVAIAGCIAVVITHFAAILLVEHHNPISQTISNLAIGKQAWILDLGLNMFAVGIFALAVGFSVWDLGKWKWTLGVVLLVLLSFDIIVIAEHNQYAETGTPEDNVHAQAVYALGALFLTAPLILAWYIKDINRNWYRASLIIAGLWLVGGPLFYYVSTSWDGLYERLVSGLIITWVALSGYMMIQYRETVNDAG